MRMRVRVRVRVRVRGRVARGARLQLGSVDGLEHEAWVASEEGVDLVRVRVGVRVRVRVRVSFRVRFRVRKAGL